jgi:hypothetical protein
MNDEDYDAEMEVLMEMESASGNLHRMETEKGILDHSLLFVDHHSSQNITSLFDTNPDLDNLQYGPVRINFDSDNDTQLQPSQKKLGISFESDDDDHTTELPVYATSFETSNVDFPLLKRNSTLTSDLPNKRVRNHSGDSNSYPCLEPLSLDHGNTYGILSSLSESINDGKYRKLIPGTKSFVTGCSSDGMNLYFPRKLKSTALTDTKLSNIGKAGTLLSVPIFKLMREKLMADKTDTKEEVTKTASNIKNTGSQLWVNKYKPKRYVDLVGDEVLSKI